MSLYMLEWNEAWSLFKEQVSEETIESHPLILMYAVDVVKELGGFPLALITVGRTMHGRTDPTEWKQAAEILKRARLCNVELSGRDEPVFEVLKFSYDNLINNNLRECFLHCSLWPEDHPIEKNELIELWMGLGLIDQLEIDMAYNIGYNYISILQFVCLLESTDNESQVKLCDVIRDMSLWIISNKGIKKDKWIVRSRASNQSRVDIKSETEKISLMYHHADEVSFDSSFRDMARITTFFFTWSSLFCASVLRSQSFSYLTVLNLKENKITAFPTEICKLLQLQFVDLSGNKIKSLPSEIGALINLKYLFLKGNPICIIPQGAMKKMKALKVLDLSPPYHHLIKENRHKLGFVHQLLEELGSLSYFGALGIELYNRKETEMISKLTVPVIRWLTISMWEGNTKFPSEFLKSSQLRKLFSLSFTNMEALLVEFGNTYELSIFGNKIACYNLGRLERLFIHRVGMTRIKWGGLDDPKIVFPLLKCITISMCDRLDNISWVVHLPCLRELTISVCHGIKQLIHGYKASERTFPSLKLLVLEGLPNLETVGDLEIVFPALETLKIFGCKRLENFPFRANNIPQKLNHICVEKKWWYKLHPDSLNTSLNEYVRFLY